MSVFLLHAFRALRSIDNKPASPLSPSLGIPSQHPITAHRAPKLRAQTPKTGAQGGTIAAPHLTWTPSDIARFRAKWEIGTAFVPITAPVAQFLKADQKTFMAVIPDAMLFILTSTGKARSVKALSQFISHAARDAGLEQKTAPGLRKARAVTLAENS